MNTMTELDAAKLIIAEFDKEIVHTLAKFIEQRGFPVNSYAFFEEHNNLIDRTPCEISKNGFLIRVDSTSQYIFVNEKDPAHTKCKTLLHELVHAMTGNYMTISFEDKKANAEMEMATESAAEYAYQNSLLAHVFRYRDTIFE